MMRSFIALPLTILLGAVIGAASASTPREAALDVYGLWLTDKENSKIRIADCGDGTPCGHIEWIDAPEPETILDAENPDEALRTRPLMQLVILNGFEAKKDQWKKGTIYDPETGKTYGSKLRRLEDGSLEVKGCLGPLCQKRIWTPAE